MRAIAADAFQENRAKHSQQSLSLYSDEWVAFTADGSGIVASATTIAALAAKLRASGISLSDVVLEKIEAESIEINLGGAELQ